MIEEFITWLPAIFVFAIGGTWSKWSLGCCCTDLDLADCEDGCTNASPDSWEVTISGVVQNNSCSPGPDECTELNATFTVDRDDTDPAESDYCQWSITLDDPKCCAPVFPVCTDSVEFIRVQLNGGTTPNWFQVRILGFGGSDIVHYDNSDLGASFDCNTTYTLSNKTAFNENTCTYPASVSIAPV